MSAAAAGASQSSKVARMQEMVREAGALIDAGEDASHILMTLQLMLVSNNSESSADAATAKAAEKAKKKEVRRVLRAKRDELRGMLANCNASIAHASAPSASSAASSASAISKAASCSQPPSRGGLSVQSAARPPSSAAADVVLPQLQLKPPVVNPKDVVPPELIEKFRAEYRAAQLPSPTPPGTAQDAIPHSPRGRRVRTMLPPSIEEFEVAHGLAPAPPGPPPNYREMLHGIDPKGMFKSFPGATTVGPDAAALSPRGRRRVNGARGAQSTLGAILAGRPPSNL